MEVNSHGILRHCEERSDDTIHDAASKHGLLRCARNDGGRASPLLAREERRERGDRFLRAHPFAEQMALLVDPAGHVLGRQFQQLARDRDRFRRQRADLARHLARLGLGVAGRHHHVDEAGVRARRRR